MAAIKWTDADAIGFQLSEKYPDVDPLTVRFTDMHRYVTGLDNFEDTAGSSTESVLESIQMAWLEYYKDNH